MSGGWTKELISILMESPLYMTLSVQERHTLLVRLAESYPSLVEGKGDDLEVGYESSWLAITENSRGEGPLL